MAGYAQVNLKEIEDSAVAFGFAPALEARFATKPLGCERVGLAYERLAPNARGPFGHRHGEQEEIYVVVGGNGRMKLDDEIVELRLWDAVRVAPATMRAAEAGPDGLELIAFGGPIRAPGEEPDAELAPGWWA